MSDTLLKENRDGVLVMAHYKHPKHCEFRVTCEVLYGHIELGQKARLDAVPLAKC